MPALSDQEEIHPFIDVNHLTSEKKRIINEGKKLLLRTVGSILTALHRDLVPLGSC